MDEPFDLDLTDRARADLLAVRRWLHQPGSGPRGRLRFSRINRALIELRFAPFRWPLSETGPIRKRTIEGHTIFYTTDESRRLIVILRVFSPFQDRSAV